MNYRIFLRKYLPTGRFTDEFCVQDGFSGIKEFMLIDPTLHMAESAAGSFEATFHHDNVAYKSNANDGKPWVERAKTRIIIRRYDNEYSKGTMIWEGRVLSCESDFYNQEHIYAEGALSYLNDSIQPVKVFKYGQTYGHPIQILDELLANHNSKCPDKILKARSSSTTPHDWNGTEEIAIGNETTMSAVSKLISVFGGHMRVVYDENDVAYIEWFEDYAKPVTSTVKVPEITFAQNLLDVTQKRDATNVVTAVYPRGYVAYSGGSDAVGDDLFKPVDDSGITPITWHIGTYIWSPRATEQDVRGCAYELVRSIDPETHQVVTHDTAATGFGESALARQMGITPRPGSGSLEVKPGDVYYISLIQSDQRACYAVTAGKLGNNGAMVFTTQAASNVQYPNMAGSDGSVQYPTTWEYQKVTIPEPSDKFKKDMDSFGYKLYLNISSRGEFRDFDTEGLYSGLLDGNGKSKMGIWKGRKIPDGIDEHITLKGLGDGTYDTYFISSGGATVVEHCPSQAGKDRAILYPKSKDKGTVATRDDLPPDGNNEMDVYFVTDEGSRYLWNQLHAWEKCEVSTVDQLYTRKIDEGVTFWVTSLQQWWVKLGDTWYQQKPFHRDGYFIYMDDLVEDYGRIEKILDYPAIVDPDMLEDYGLAYLFMAQFEDVNFTISAIDMKLANPDVDTVYINVLSPVKVTSPVHGISGMFCVRELEIPFNDLGNATFEVGYSTVNRLTRNTSDYVKVG